ncbi:MAG: efflux transporter outer membrane subunit [Verrucomicrobiota bacterium]|nr:efflux transporter outer membrane subunit [Verrucomicrobiota bacterium]
MTALKCVSLVATTLIFTACATSPDRSEAPAVDLPKAWTSQSFNTAPTAWLADFNSPQLEALVLEALAKSPSLKATAARFAQSVAEARISGAELKPSAGLGLKSARQKINTFGPNSTGGVIFENYELTLDLRWEIDLWGRLRDQTSAAVARAEGYQADLDAARLSLAAQITKGWLNLIEAQQQLALSEHTAQAYRDNQSALESRFKLGLAEGFDLRRILTQTASAEADTVARERTLDQATRSLEVILGRYPAGALNADITLPSLPPTIPAGLPADLIQRRPDLVSAERKLAAADRELRASKKDLLPQISLTASGGTSSQEFENLLDGNFGIWTLLGNITQPIFQGGRIRANIDRNTALRIQAAANYKDKALRAFLEVETTLAAEQFIRREQFKLDIAAKEAIATEALAWDRYRSGIGDFLSALDAKRTADVARSRLLSVSNIFLQNRVNLYLALGGAFDSNGAIQPPSETAKNISNTNDS